jgi:hypothetical protein
MDERRAAGRLAARRGAARRLGTRAVRCLGFGTVQACGGVS